jgi:predicted ATP-binding protein involved in virulence
MDMNNKHRILKSFSIKKLFGTTDVMIPFEGTAKILIGVNGLGKTQVLNILYYTLSKRFNKLVEYVFDSITIEFGDNTKVNINNSNRKKKAIDNPLVKNVLQVTGFTQFLQLYTIVNNAKDVAFALRINPLSRKIIETTHLTSMMIEEAMKLWAMNEQADLLDEDLIKKQKMIDVHLSDYEILYFPTYRRIEEDFKGLRYNEEKFDINHDSSSLIHFDMDDVQKRFAEIAQNIDKLSKEGFAKISNEILSQLIKGFPIIDTLFLHTITQKDIEIILARVGNQLPTAHKDIIQKMVSNKEIQEKDKYLLYFLQKLIDIYKQQRVLDQSIKQFRDVCNKYLVNKKVIYDESRIEIYVQLDKSSEKLELAKLSLGEKQIISIFSKVYLASEECRFIVLFDEPELSLAIDWQQNLLPDIVKSGKCHFLLAVTHSPFIFENELEKYAIGLNVYFKPSKPHAA